MWQLWHICNEYNEISIWHNIVFAIFNCVLMFDCYVPSPNYIHLGTLNLIDTLSDFEYNTALRHCHAKKTHHVTHLYYIPKPRFISI